MATNHEQPDAQDDDQLSWLLTSALGAPPMRAEFVAALNKRLAAEFAARGRESRNGAAAASSNGALSSHGTCANDSLEVVPAEPGANPALRGRGRLGRRLMVAGATAASLAVVAAVLSDPPAWAAAFRAFVRSIGDLTLGERNDAAVEIEVAEELAQGEEVNVANVPPGQLANRIEIDAPLPVESLVVAETTVAPAKKPQAVEPRPPVAIAPAWEPFAEPLAADELSRRIDDELAALWRANGIRPVGPASDAEFMRRVFLDLTGRIPSVFEAQEFLEDSSPDRRELLVDRLLAHRDHATHLAAVWRAILLPSDVDLSRVGGPVKFEEWLADRFARNVSYAQIVQELLLAEGRVAESGPLLFYAALKLNPEELAARTSRAFLGVRMECAQCHDHHFDDISQHDFWSFAAFFARISRPRGKMEMTSPVLAVRDNQQGDVTIPDTNEVVPPRLPLSAEEVQDTPDGPSRRQQLVDWLTARDNGHFARATVNRVWAHLFGRGLVEPVDDMRPANPPLAPEVLETLARDFAASNFDLKRLLRALVLTKTYQLTSRSEENDPARELHFAQMNIKSFTAEQLYDCIAVATRQETSVAATVDEPGLLRFSDMTRQGFIEQFRAPAGLATDYHAGIRQALTLMHGALIHSATDMTTSGLLKSLAAPFLTDDQRLDALFLSTLSRYPTDSERELMLEHVTAATTEAERQQALGDILWALLNSAEFSFNH
jgi:hypothetical protein